MMLVIVFGFSLSLILMSSVNSFPQNKKWFRANVRFPDPLYNGDEFGMYNFDISTSDEKRVRSPVNGWPMESQITVQQSQYPVHTNSRSDDTRPQKIKGGPMPDDSKIYFPDESPKEQEKKNKTVSYVPSGYKACSNGKTFCEDADFYPRSHLRTVLQKDEKLFQAYFGKDVVQPPPSNETVMNRIDTGSLQEKSLCQSRERIVFPKMAENVDGNWLYIANVDNYLQGVRVEECLQNSGTPCDAMATFPLGYKATCEQKYMYRKLVALNSSGKVTSDSFRLPSCCTCKVFFTAGLRSRSASAESNLLLLTISPDSTTATFEPAVKMRPRRVNNSSTQN